MELDQQIQELMQSVVRLEAATDQESSLLNKAYAGLKAALESLENYEELRLS